MFGEHVMSKYGLAHKWCFSVLVIGSLAFQCRGAQGQGIVTPDAAARKLAGDHSHEWIYKQMRMTMGASSACTEGEVYKFSADHHLVVESCENGKVVRTNHNWSIAKEGQLDIVLTIDDKPYYLLFKDAGIAHLMILRDRSGSKPMPTQDREFRLSSD
jgi:hypothetical protein